MPDKSSIDVLVLGGGVAGTAAAWQAKRSGASVLVVEPSPWVGGMITSAGVSAFDGNKGTLATGFYRRLRDDLEAHYGGKEAVDTGWISHTCFEPKVAAKLLKGYLDEEGVEVWHGAEASRVLREENRIVGAIIKKADGSEVEVRAKVTIEATEYGDVLNMAGVTHRVGREAKSTTGEDHAPLYADMEVQDMTVCAILKRHEGKAPAVPRPEGYDPTEFDGCVKEWCTRPDEDFLNHPLHPFDSMLSYATLPNDKYLLNWPQHGNDSPDTAPVFGTSEERAEALRAARHRTLCFVHFMQNELNHPEWGLAEDEFDTPDNLAYIPYVREARRVIGVTTLFEKDVLPLPGCARPAFQPDSIAVGDYFLDHHHSQEHRPPGQRLEENYPDNAPFQVPYGCLVPEQVDGLIATEKSISVTHIVNGCTRLQPVVMLMGQVAGLAAATAAKQNIEPREVDVRALQKQLIDDRIMLYIYRDLDHTHPHFGAIQRVAMAGAMSAEDPYEFRPDEPIDSADAAAWSENLGIFNHADFYQDGMTRAEFATRLAEQLH